MIPASYKPEKKFMELAIAEAKRAGDRGDYPIGAVITRLTGRREVVIAPCAPAPACGPELARWSMASPRKISPRMAASAGRNITSGGRA
jgi:hypothetical protein